MLIHLTKYYAKDGTGIRSILDIWLYEKHYGSKMDRNHIRQRLEKIKLKKFMQHIVGVSRIWFVGTESNLLDEKRAEYIFANCTYFASAI